MRLGIVYALVFALTAIVAGAPQMATASAPLTQVVLVSWDGVQRNHLYELLNAGMLPNLSELVSSGKILNITINCAHDTATRPAHTTILTGVCAETLGVWTNYHHVILPGNATIYYQLKQANPSIETAHIYQNIESMYLFLGYGYYQPYQKARQYMNLPRQYYNTTIITMSLVSPTPPTAPFFVFFYIKIPDAAGHEYGENSPEYTDAIIESDRVLGVLVASYPTAKIYVTTDHGFKEGGTGHQGQPDIWIGTNDPLLDIHYQVEITPYILSLFR